MLALPTTQISPSWEINSFALLRSESSVTTASPVPQTTTMAPPATASLLAMVDAGFIEVFGNDEERDMDDPQFHLRKIFREGAHRVDNMINELRDENTRITNRIETKLDLVLMALRTPWDETDERLVALEHEVRDLKDIRLVLDNLHYWQLTKIHGDIGKVEERIAGLDPKFSQGLDEVNLRVDDILMHLASPLARNNLSIGRSIPIAEGDDNQHHPRDTPLMAQTNIDTAPSTPIPPTRLAGRLDGSYGSDVNPTMGQMRYNPPNGQRWVDVDVSKNYNSRFRETPGLNSSRPVAPVPQPYYRKRDMRDIAAQTDPNWYNPQCHSQPGLTVNPTMGDGGDHPLGGQIISPRQWDCARVAQSAGVSPLDVAALGCQEYHGYDEGYYPLTQAIIFRCGYRNHIGNEVITCHNDIILLHRWVMDMWVNPRAQQRGPSVERILDKGLPIFPKLEMMSVDATVEFYNKLQKTSALFLLTLMAFDAINLRMGSEGLCPPGLSLTRYAEIAVVLMEVLPCLLP
jgi:hypothetical protein